MEVDVRPLDERALDGRPLVEGALDGRTLDERELEGGPLDEGKCDGVGCLIFEPQYFCHYYAFNCGRY